MFCNPNHLFNQSKSTSSLTLWILMGTFVCPHSSFAFPRELFVPKKTNHVESDSELLHHTHPKIFYKNFSLKSM